MDRDSRKIISTSIITLAFGGFSALAYFWKSVLQVIVAFFPFFVEATKQSLEDYLTSPYFITGIIMAIASGCGIWFGAKGGKLLFLIISIICEIASLVSILSNVL